MKSWLLAALLGVLPISMVHAGIRYLVVAGSSRDPTEIAKRANDLSTSIPNGIIAQSADCGDTRNVFAFVAEVSDSLQRARSAAERLKPAVKDAYIKKCDVKAGSLLALGIGAVDASIADLPKDAVNWNDTDRVYSTILLSPSLSLVIERYYAPGSDDPLEGRREGILLATTDGRRRPLEESCYGTKGASLNGRLIAFECEREQAADNILHSVLVYTDDGRLAQEIERCREPKWAAKDRLTCLKESVDSSGKLALAPFTAEIAPP